MSVNKGVHNLSVAKLFLFLLAFCAFFTSSLYAEHAPATESETHKTEATATSHDAKEHETGKFNAGEMILDHIKDAHDWHMWDWNGHAVSIPLPVIIYNQTSGKLDFFMSTKLNHGHSVYNGYKLEEGKLVSEAGDKILDFSITKNVAAMLVSVLLICIIFFSVARAYKKNEGKAPRGMQNLMEMLVLFVRDEVAKPSIGVHAYKRFMPFLLTLFCFIFFNNLLGLIPIFPGGANVTGNIAIAMVLALLVFIITTFSANGAYWKHIFLPDVPVAMYIIMVPIEILGVVLKPFVLMLRLFANVTAGHIIMLGFFSLIFIFGAMNQYVGYSVAPFSWAFTVFMNFLELLVAFLQAYVFTLLAAIYFGSAVEEHHHHSTETNNH